jgi:Glycosyltransferase family 87
METGGVIATAAPMGAHRNVSAGGLAATLTRPGIVALLWIGVALHFAVIIQQAAAHRTQWDFSHYYVSALAMRHGLNPYTTDLRPLGARLGLAGISRSSYPPSFILGFEPLTFLRPGTAWLTWLIVNLAALVWLVDTWRGVRKPQILAVAALALLYPPISINLFYSQTQILILRCWLP